MFTSFLLLFLHYWKWRCAGAISYLISPLAHTVRQNNQTQDTQQQSLLLRRKILREHNHGRIVGEVEHGALVGDKINRYLAARANLLKVPTDRKG